MKAKEEHEPGRERHKRSDEEDSIQKQVEFASWHDNLYPIRFIA